MSRLTRTQNRELSFRCIAYNMHRLNVSGVKPEVLNKVTRVKPDFTIKDIFCTSSFCIVCNLSDRVSLVSKETL